MNPKIIAYHDKHTIDDQEICEILFHSIEAALPDAEGKIWHAHPVWFINENPIVGYSKQKPGWRLMFWSGADFEEEQLNLVGKRFMDASIFFTSSAEINPSDLQRWLEKARATQWDYKNLIKRKGQFVKLK